MVLSIIFLEDKHKIVLHSSIFYEYQQLFQHRICFSIQPQLQLINLHRKRRYFVIKLHTWFCLSYFLKTNIKLYCIYQYFMSINSFFNTVSVSRYRYIYKLLTWVTLLNHVHVESVYFKSVIQSRRSLFLSKLKYIAKITCGCFPTSTRKFT